MARKRDVRHARKTALCSHIIESTSFKDNEGGDASLHTAFHSNTLIFQFTLKLHALVISNNAGNVDAKDESKCSQAIRTRRLTTLLKY
jgi:hypothetical protein